MIHTGVFPFNCTTCGKGFRRKNGLQGHVCTRSDTTVEKHPELPAQSGSLVDPPTTVSDPQQPLPKSSPVQAMFRVESLGNCTVTFKDRQVIVKGPDREAAKDIAKKLASREVKLGKDKGNGKQVLLVPVQAPPAQAPAK